MTEKISRRNVLKLSGAALGSLAIGPSAAEGGNELHPHSKTDPAERNTLFESLKPFYPGEKLAADEMRISFLGTTPIQRRTQVCSSVFVELGNGDSFVFDCGAGVTVNYNAMQIPMSKMRKVFLTHLHGDHTSDLTHIYGFGPQGDGKSPLYIWGPSASGVEAPTIPGKYYDDGTLNFCWHFREMNRWHTEAQSFVSTQWTEAEGDGYDIIVTELNWKTGGKRLWNSNEPYPGPDPDSSTCTIPVGGIAYDQNDVKISFFPAVHDRNGSISYKLEWNGLSMIFTGDTKPSQFLIDNATNGHKEVDVLISEMVVPPEVWAEKNGANTALGLQTVRAIQENSHTPQKAFGYILNATAKRRKAPRLAVATHFQAEDDTIFPALHDIRSWYPKGDVTIATDFMVINVSKKRIQQRRAVVSDYSWDPPVADPRALSGEVDPKYKDLSPSNPYKPMAPLAQFDQCLLNNVIDPCLYDPTDYGCTNPYIPK